LNQQLSEDNSKDFYGKLIKIIDGWKPYVTNYCKLKDKRWHTNYEEENEYVKEFIEDTEEPYTKQYHHAWSKCEKSKEIIELIKSCDYLKTDDALKVFTEITGIKTYEDDEKTKLIARLEELGAIKNGKIIV
jgi:hypothetical protein